MDTTADFQAELARWGNLTPGHRMPDDDIAALIAYARNARTAEPWMWGALHNALTNHSGWNKKVVEKEVKDARVHADLGCIPHSVEEFVPVFLREHGYTMTYDGRFTASGHASDINEVLAAMRIWTDVHGQHKNTYEAALRLWMPAEARAILRRTYEDLAHDPALDPDKSELRKYIRRIVAQDPDPIIAERNYLAAEIAFENMIWRTKNGMRGRYFYWAHLMPVLHGAQEDGKSAAVKHLLAPLGDLVASVGFDVLDDGPKSYMLSTMPVLFFDEMSGVGRADIEKLKALMTDQTRLLRQIYERASVRTLVFNGIGCTNKDLSVLIRDETGNRRIIQCESRRNDVLGGALDDIDALKIWRSVDENEKVAPRYRTPEIIEIIREVQAEQRHRSAVEDWITEGGRDVPLDRWMTATEAFADFYEFIQKARPGEVRSWDNRKLGAELTRLSKPHNGEDESFHVKMQKVKGTSRYRITRSNVVDLAHPAHLRLAEVLGRSHPAAG